MKSVFSLLLLALLITGGVLAYEAHTFLNTPASGTPRDVVISIAPGATFDRVAWDLKKAGAVTDVTRFRLLAQYKDALGKVRAGEFLVNTGWTPVQVLTQITEGKALLYRLSIREGLTWWETARAVEEQGFARFEDFKAVIHDPAFLKEHNIPFANAEGFLFPETYLLKKPRTPLDKEQARIVATAMVRMFWKKTEPLWNTLPLRTDAAPTAPPVKARAMRSPPPVVPVPPAAPEAAVPSAPAEAPPASPPPASGEAQPENSAAAGAGRPPAPLSAPAAPLPAQPISPDQPGQQIQGRPDGAPDSSGALPAIPQGAVAPAQGDVPPLSPQDAASASPTGQAAPGSPAQAESAVESLPDGPKTPADVDPEALRRLVILASLVEKETGVPAERGLVAGVYANRLRLGMLLQCDPTIIYGIGESFTGSIRRSQIDNPNNPYNTYQRPGLPPGPICSSGLDSLKAAAQPTQHDYLYFVATGTDGGHTFSKTLNEHNKAVQVYRNVMRGQK